MRPLRPLAEMNALGHGVVKTEGIADGNHPLPRCGQRRNPPQLREGQMVGVDLYQRDIQLLVLAENGRGIRMAISGLDLDPGLPPPDALDDVVVRQDLAIRRDDHTGAAPLDPLFLVRTRAASTLVGAEEPVKGGLLGKGAASLGLSLDDAGVGDGHDRRIELFRHFRNGGHALQASRAHGNGLFLLGLGHPTVAEPHTHCLIHADAKNERPMTCLTCCFIRPSVK